MTLKHQYNSGGNGHRIVELDIAGFLKESGDWVHYGNLATFDVKEVKYIAATDYFSGILEPDVIYQLTKTDFKSEKVNKESKMR